MIRTVDLRGRALSKAQYNLELPRATLNVAEAMVLIQPILDRVKNGTEADLIALAQEFDGVTPLSIRVPQQALDKALSELAPEIRGALELSISRVKKVHNDQVRSEKTTTVVDGGTVGYIDFTGNIDTCIAIRTALLYQGTAYVQAGAGVVADSDPESENQECRNKAAAVLTAIHAANRLGHNHE
jgi:hypothetical protein